MAKPIRVIVVAGNGTNCERETAHACRLAGADVVDTVMVWDLLAGEAQLGDYDWLCLPGGFMDGDDLGAGKAAAIRWRQARLRGGERRLVDDLRQFIGDEKLVLGICNGFQLMAKLGLVPASGRDARDPLALPVQQATLGHNDSGRFEDRWVRLGVDPASPCVFTRGLTILELPVRHGEGKVILAGPEVQGDVRERHLGPLVYLDDKGLPTEAFPANPNGSAGGLAGLCDPSGRCFGLMPHPEAFLHRTNHPQWTRRRDLPEEGAGLAIFRNAVSYLRAHLAA